MVFYDKYANLCHERGTSPTEAAAKIGLSTGAPTNWAYGSKPHRSTIVKIARFFDVPPSYFDDEPEAKESAPGADGTEGGAVALLSLYNGFSAGDQAELLAYAQFLARRAANRQDRRG